MIKVKNILKKDNTKNILILLIVSAFICIPLINKNIDIFYDDGVQHICRLIGTMQSIEEGQSFPVIMSKLCNEFGYSWNIFYSPLTAYIPLIFRLIGASFINCIKLFMFLVVFLSGVTMYFFTNEVTKNKKIALLAGIFYIFAPYRLTDMYARNALAELTSFVFVPMVFHGLYGILKLKQNKKYLLIIGSVGLVLTHNVITMYVAILCFIYLLTQIKKLKNIKILKEIIISLLFIILITSFYWTPLLEHRLSVDYEVFKPGRMERTEVLTALKLNFMDLFVTPKEYIRMYEIGFISCIILLLTPIAIKLFVKKYRRTDFFKFYIFSLIIGIICCFMTLKIFPFEYLPSILKMIQFSYRLLEFSSFFFAFVVAVNLGILIKKIKYKDIIVITVLLMITTCLYIPHLHYKDNIDENKLIEGIPVTSQTGRIHAGCASFEYLPSKAFENRSYIEKRSDDVLILDGSAQIEDQNKENTNLTCKLSYVLEETKLELPYIYYLGYEVTMEQNGQITKLKTYETENGFVGVTIPVLEETKLQVKYQGTTIMKVSIGISILGLILLIIKIIIESRKFLQSKKEQF